MNVCCPNPLLTPMTDPQHATHDQKRRHIDSSPGVMELKVREPPQLGPGEQQHTPQELHTQGTHHHLGEAGMGPTLPNPLPMTNHGEVNGHKNDSVYDFDPEGEEHLGSELGRGLGESCHGSPGKGSPPSETSDSTVKNEPELEALEDSEMADEEESIGESFDGGDFADPSSAVTYECVPRRGRGRPRGSKNRVDGRGRGRGYNRLMEDRSGSSYDLRNLPDPFNSQRRGRPRSRFIVDLGEQNHEVWTKSKEELNISDAELTTLLLSLLESRRDCGSSADTDTMLGVISAEYNKWKDKFTSQVSMLSHYASIHNTNCCTCLGIKKKKYIPAGTGKRGRPRKYPPPVGYGPGMQRPDTIDEDGNIFEPQIILKDNMVKNEPDNMDPAKGGMPNGEGGEPGMGPPHTSGGAGGCMQLLPRPILTKEELEKRKEYYNNHKNKIKYVCHYCQVHFYHKPNFDFHISRLEEGGKCKIFEKVNNLYLCEACGEGFSWREKLEKHLRLAEQHGTHNQKELLMYGDFQCNMCGKTFNKRTTYLQHIKWHEDREDIPCVICGTMFKQTDLRHHLMEIHSNDSLPCSYCGKLFTARKYLEKHELVHQGGNFPCPECGKTFSQKSNMQQHLKTHALDRDHACDHCGQTFSQRAGLCHHLKKHFGPAEFTEECEVCGQYFSNEYNLKVHKRKVHNMAIDGLQEEPTEYLSSPMPQHLPLPDDLREKAFGVANTAVKNMLGMSLGSGVSLGLPMKQEGGGEGLDESGVSQIHMRDPGGHMGDMRHMGERRDTGVGLMKEQIDTEEQLRMGQHHMGLTDDTLHMPQDLTRMTANQAHMSDDSGRMSAAPPSPLLQPHMGGGGDMRTPNTPNTDSPGRITDTPHMADNLNRMAAENFGRMTGTPGGYLAEHLRRMAENQSRMSDTMAHYDERDNYSRLGDNLRSMSRGSAGEMGRLGDNLGRMTDNLSHMGVIRPTQTPSSTPQWPPHMQNHAALDGMNQATSQASQHTLYPLPFWPYDPSLRQYHH